MSGDRLTNVSSKQLAEHCAAIQRVLGRAVNVEDFNDVKAQISTDYDWSGHLKPVVEAMTAEGTLEIDHYVDGEERHEFLEIIENLLQLTEA
ncbi:MAG: hypothetical protein WB661_05495 [Candidatus Bathyarchaeia archaeon]